MNAVLIVNNHEDYLHQLKNIFRNSGYYVICTTNSLMTIDLFNQYQPCAVIIDIYMDEKDGFEITKEIRSISEEAFILVISARESCLNIITYLGADLALPLSTSAELMVNAVAVAEKKQLFSKSFCLLSPNHRCHKKPLKVA